MVAGLEIQTLLTIYCYKKKDFGFSTLVTYDWNTKRRTERPKQR